METPHEGEERRATDRIPVRIEVHFGDAAAAAEALRSYAVNFSVGASASRPSAATRWVTCSSW